MKMSVGNRCEQKNLKETRKKRKIGNRNSWILMRAVYSQGTSLNWTQGIGNKEEERKRKKKRCDDRTVL